MLMSLKNVLSFFKKNADASHELAYAAYALSDKTIAIIGVSHNLKKLINVKNV